MAVDRILRGAALSKSATSFSLIALAAQFDGEATVFDPDGLFQLPVARP